MPEFAVWINICVIVPCEFSWPILLSKSIREWFRKYGMNNLDVVHAILSIENKRFWMKLEARRNSAVYGYTSLQYRFYCRVVQIKLQFLLWSLAVCCILPFVCFHFCSDKLGYPCVVRKGRRDVLKTEKPRKKSPKTAKPQEISSKTENRIKLLTHKGLVVFRFSLSVINFYTYYLILLSEVLSGYSLVILVQNTSMCFM